MSNASLRISLTPNRQYLRKHLSECSRDFRRMCTHHMVSRTPDAAPRCHRSMWHETPPCVVSPQCTVYDVFRGRGPSRTDMFFRAREHMATRENVPTRSLKTSHQRQSIVAQERVVSVWGQLIYIFSIFIFSCLVWRVIDRYGGELSTVRRRASHSPYGWSYGTLNIHKEGPKHATSANIGPLNSSL